MGTKISFVTDGFSLHPILAFVKADQFYAHQPSSTVKATIVVKPWICWLTAERHTTMARSSARPSPLLFL
jgi:hypothetical protein